MAFAARIALGSGLLLNMWEKVPTTWFDSNRYSAQSECEHCGGTTRHETWCVTLNSTVFYAYRIVSEPSALSLGDAIILHSLGAAWTT